MENTRLTHEKVSPLTVCICCVDLFVKLKPRRNTFSHIRFRSVNTFGPPSMLKCVPRLLTPRPFYRSNGRWTGKRLFSINYGICFISFKYISTSTQPWAHFYSRLRGTIRWFCRDASPCLLACPEWLNVAPDQRKTDPRLSSTFTATEQL